MYGFYGQQSFCDDPMEQRINPLRLKLPQLVRVFHFRIFPQAVGNHWGVLALSINIISTFFEQHTGFHCFYKNIAIYNGSVIIPSSPTPTLPSMNLYRSVSSGHFAVRDLRVVALVLPDLTSIGTIFPSFCIRKSNSLARFHLIEQVKIEVRLPPRKMRKSRFFVCVWFRSSVHIAENPAR